ncbi:hypothetical protein NJH77_26110 [Serratia fonticola]|uniref:hypothetical protein n=1 Tax=Serratia fonticola TaxID=47917 RepID=UPI002097ACB4|nr:hypothetical protein [Serratia fonticola]MCO7512721.1 hypothetical protein [Serratia fonticola]
MSESISKEELKEREEETIKRAELLFDYQVTQYDSAISSIRRLEDKATKMFGVVSMIITIVLLIVRFWWKDIFEGDHTPLQAICWISLSAILVFVMIAWGFTFSAMQTQSFEKPNSSMQMKDFFLDNKRYVSLTYAANSYSEFTNKIDRLHAKKAKLVNNCSEAMLFGAWAFIVFLISFSVLKLNA